MHQKYYYAIRVWNYKDINPKIVAKKVLRDENGKLTLDYKFF